MEDISEQEARAFVGPRADYYLEKWSKPWSFNWAALFVSVPWLAYRKLYVASLILFALLAFETVFSEVLFAEDETVRMFDKIFSIGVPAFCGFKGNGWYAGRMQRVVERLRAEELSERGYLQTLARHGGTNPLASLLVLVCAVMFVAVKLIQQFAA